MGYARVIYSELYKLEKELDGGIKLVDPETVDIKVLERLALLKKKISNLKVLALVHIQEIEKEELHREDKK